MTIAPSAPTVHGRCLSLAELGAVVEGYAESVRAGNHVAEFRTDRRWHVRIHQDEDVEVWLISWTTEQGTELHDHGGSSGAFTVVHGALNEYVWTDDGGGRGLLVNQLRREREVVAFGADYVHDVRNHHEVSAVSVHAYSPPIRLMRYYDTVTTSLVHTGSSWTDDPEAPAPEREAS
jgi:predicted metal-dependent enzyme (double-stranded beta helix superfamily)